MKQFDAVIIGFGKGGKTLAGALANAGKKVALVEKDASMYGGTCINVGCIPSKSLRKNADLSQSCGGSFPDRAARYRAAILEKTELTAKLRQKNYTKIANLPHTEILNGTASFLDDHHVSVDFGDHIEELEAEQLFINTGARPFVPPIPGLTESNRVYLSETLMSLAELPEHLVIIGGGYIGMEFASIYRSFGSHVTVIQDGSLFLPREDEEIAAAAELHLRTSGIELIFSATVTQIQDGPQATAVTYETAEGSHTIQANAILVATGRRPNVGALHLENAGVALTERGAVNTDKTLRTTAPNIWAMGDVRGDLQFTYLSLDDYRIVQSQLFGDGSRTTENRGAVPYSVFLDPPISRIGLTEAQAKSNGYHTVVKKLSAQAIPKSQVLGQPVGLLKAVIDADTGLILGVHLFCAKSHELINQIKMAMDAKLPYTVLRDAIYTHPTMSEAFNDLFAG